ncbi:peptide-methionine (S)-S-oxide reductase [Aquimarina sp. ERC-38]|uniref:peptide-methionine (S)-S-oxide reductase n=1 Tax=Aquimarina sp. ERC-38 TaxID=2949996 RepID=UPI002248155E|nr:peptide-methionine (S)-S-oxide reductase [Aquimarina sp. ERC-38]UZO80600.1 peptide-methionine (S)-S-oxide reductase [Aquimarina sp. ERC-38]
MEPEKIGLGGGCHWCTEAVFQALNGVIKVEQGYIRSIPPNKNFSEGVIVHFQPESVCLKDLIKVHVCTHKSTKNHSFRKKYRSAIYVTSDQQKIQCQEILKTLEQEFSISFITEVLAFKEFKASRIKIQNYYQKDRNKPFCTRYIDPKIAMMKAEFTHLVKNEF